MNKEKTRTEAFPARLAKAIVAKDSRLCVGLDPRLERLPEEVREQAESATEALKRFCLGVIEAVADLVPVVKPQVAYFERYGPEGLAAFREVCKAAKAQGLLVIADIKRSDIGSTCQAYAEGYLGPLSGQPEPGLPWVRVDAVTVNPYFGSDGLAPFFEAAEANGKGVYVLVKTSNPSWLELQGLSLPNLENVAMHVLGLVAQWGRKGVDESGYSYVGAVVPATHPDEAGEMRARAPRTPFLVPGVGAQGGNLSEITSYFDVEGQGAVVNVSRSVLYPEREEGESWQAAIWRAAARFSDELNAVLLAAGKQTGR